MKPYYRSKGISIYHGDCREVLPTLPKVELVLTDPPYPDYHAELYGYSPELLDVLRSIEGRQFVFWSAKVDFPMDYCAIHIWDKKVGCGSQYERIFERGGHRNWKVFRHYLINSTVAASFTGDTFTGHPSQKPRKLIEEVLTYAKGETVLDPFMGSGTTLVAARNLNRKAIGIELEEKYCEIAAQRLETKLVKAA